MLLTDNLNHAYMVHLAKIRKFNDCFIHVKLLDRKTYF